MSKTPHPAWSTMPVLSRRAWLKLVGGSATVSIVLSACVDQKNKLIPIDAPPGPDAPMGCSTSDAKTTIADNHVHGPHVLMVSSQEIHDAVTNGTPIVKHIMGEAQHDHVVTIMPDQVQMLVQGGSVMDESTVGGIDNHMHLCTVSCAG